MTLFQTIQPLILASGSPRRQELLKSAGIHYTLRVADSEETPASGEAPAAYALRAARGKARCVADAVARELSADLSSGVPGNASGNVLGDVSGNVFGDAPGDVFGPNAAGNCALRPVVLTTDAAGDGAARPAVLATGTVGNGAVRPVILAADTIVVLEGRIIGKPKDHEDALHNLQALGGKTHTVITACCLLHGQGAEEREEAFYVESRVRMWQAPLELLKAYAYSDEPLDKAGGYAVQGSAGFLVDAIEGSWTNVVGLPLTEVVQKLLEYKIIIPSPTQPG